VITGAGARRLRSYPLLEESRRARGAGGPHGQGPIKVYPLNRKKCEWGKESQLSRRPRRPAVPRGGQVLARRAGGERSEPLTLPWASSSGRRHPEGSTFFNAGQTWSSPDSKKVSDRNDQLASEPFENRPLSEGRDLLALA